jgi:raffinose/stachyose/melibiose transport system substrate-binding protein
MRMTFPLNTVLALAALSGGMAASQVQAQETRTLTQWDIRTRPADNKIMVDAVARFERAHPGYKVERSAVLNDPYKVKLKIAFGANEPPCVFSSWGGGPLREYVKAGQVLDLSPYLGKDPAFRDRFVAASFDTTRFDGKVYGIPGEDTTLAVVHYNKELFDRLGLQPPKTWPEMVQVMGKLKANGVAPFALANKAKWPGSMVYMYLVDRLGGAEAFRKAATRAPGGSFADPAFVEAGRMLQEMVKVGAFAPGFNGLDYDVGGSRRLLYAGKAAMTVMGTWEIGAMTNENAEFVKKMDFFAFPTIPGGRGSTGVIGTVGDNFYSVASSCRHPEAAVELVKTLVDDEAVQARLAEKRIVPVKGLTVTDPGKLRLLKMLNEASNVQLWYDQELPPVLGELHKDLVQALLALSITPEEAANKMEAAAREALR